MAPKPTKFSIDLANAKQLALRSINQRDPQGLAVGPFEEWVIGFNIKFVEWLVPWYGILSLFPFLLGWIEYDARVAQNRRSILPFWKV